MRSPHAHARILDIDVSARSTSTGWSTWSGPTTTCTGPMADPLPLLIPHPALTHGRTQYALARDEVNYVGEAVVLVVADDRYVAEDAVGRIQVSYELLPPVVGLDAARAAEQLVHDDVPGNWRATARAGDRRRARRDRRRAAHAEPRPDRRAQRLDAAGGPRHGGALGRPTSAG